MRRVIMGHKPAAIYNRLSFLIPYATFLSEEPSEKTTGQFPSGAFYSPLH